MGEVSTGISRRGLVITGTIAGAGLAATPSARPSWSIADAPFRPAIDRWPDHGLHAAWLGHSTVLLKIDGFTVLTDPIFSAKAGVHLGLFSVGVKRLVRPALKRSDLPKIDLVLLSHAHMDHLDIPSVRSLEGRSTEVVTAWQTADLLRPERYRRVTELRWNGTTQVGPASIRAIEVRHWGARIQTDTYRGYNGYLLTVGSHRILFGGDTANTDLFRKNRAPGGVHLALMPIGAYNPWIGAHCTPEQAWHMSQGAGAEFVLPIHHQTFALGREPRSEPMERLRTAAGTAADRVTLSSIGQEFHL